MSDEKRSENVLRLPRKMCDPPKRIGGRAREIIERLRSQVAELREVVSAGQTAYRQREADLRKWQRLVYRVYWSGDDVFDELEAALLEEGFLEPLGPGAYQATPKAKEELEGE